MIRYRDELAWLYGLESRGIKLGLERIQHAAAVRGHPERDLTIIHVAGTNGKGSVVTMLESMLRAAGYRTGQFTSPHLHRYVERVRINGRPISEREAARRIHSLRHDPDLPQLTFFEYTTLLAFEAFRDASCDCVLLEVGLGGRLDSTNIVTPRVSVITNVSLEHQRILGETRAQIAREKAGIIKPGVPCVVGAKGQEVRRVIGRVARRHKAPVRWLGRDFEASWEGRKLDVRVGRKHWPGLSLGLSGRHQGDNAACAIAALQELDPEELSVPEEAVRRGLRSAKWPGRLELHRGEPSFLFDAAHNAAGCATLCSHLDSLDWPGPVVLLFAAMKDKRHERMLAAFDGSVASRIYVAPRIERSVAPARLAELRPGTVARSVRDGLARARRAAGPGGLVVVAGSIFLVSEARALIKGVRTDPAIGM